MPLLDINRPFLSLVRLGIGHSAEPFPAEVDWKGVQDLAFQQDLSAIVLDGIEALRKSMPGVSLPEKKVLVPWAGEVVREYEYRYEAYRRAVAELAGFYNTHGFKMMVLKGYGLSLYYPVPSHRPCGDIDIWLFGRYKEADEVLTRELGIPVDNSVHHHTVFSFLGCEVENHFDFVNVYGHRNGRLEKVLKRLGEDDSCFTEVDGQRVYLPSPNLNALFLLRHTMLHFAMPRLILRQVLDWGFFVEKNRDQVDWPWFVGVCNEFRMTRFLSCLNAICIEALGFDASLFAGMPCLGAGKERVLADMLHPEFTEVLPEVAGLVRRVCFKYRRWRAHAWKRKLCYGDSDLVSFFVSAWEHLVKPRMI